MNAMTDRKVAEVLLLFKYLSPHMRSPNFLVYIRRFSIKQNPEPNRGPGLYLISRITRTTVIPIQAIEHSIHLIPRFDSNIGATTKIFQEIQRNREEFSAYGYTQLNSTATESSEDARFNKPCDALEYYSEFYLNCCTYRHAYENIY